MATSSVTLSGMQLLGPGPFGSRWTVLGEEGWYDGLDPSEQPTPRGDTDGSWPVDASSLGRAFRVWGIASFPTAAAAKQARDQLVSLASPGSLVPFTWTDSAGTRTAMVQRAARAKIVWLHDRMFRWELGLHAPDPLRYGARITRTIGSAGSAKTDGIAYPLTYPLTYGSVSAARGDAAFLPNAGTRGYWVRLRHDGPATNPTYTVAETGDQIAYRAVIPAGGWVDIDCGDRRVMASGTVPMRHKTTYRGSWLVIPPGGATLTWTADAATADAVLTITAYEGAWE